MHLLNFSLLSALFTAAALADFHIVKYIDDDGDTSYQILPSNKYNCVQIGNFGYVSTGTPGDGYFQTISRSTCGITAPLDYYKRSDGHYDFYINNGDGSLQGTCYYNVGSHTVCNGDTREKYYEQYVCYSYICK